jgi:lipopolysaccharide biosynthesis glycosyltransferase
MDETQEPLKIFVGWDSREDIAYRVCKESIEHHASVPVEIIPLKQKQLRRDGFYSRPVDKLASTEFTFTRFLIPELMEHKGWALFIDCDFVFLDDVKKLFDQAANKYAVMCAQHDYTPKETTKMDGQIQHIYPRKNWSSMMLFNCSHPANQSLNKHVVNNANNDGAYFHRLSWIPDKWIGEISHEWNWLVGWYKEPEDGNPKALHYTEGGPWFEEYADCEYATEYYKIERQYHQKQITYLADKMDAWQKREVKIDDIDLPDQKKSLMKHLVKVSLDPQGICYGSKQDFVKLWEQVETTMSNKVATIESDGGINYKSKGHKYDTYLEAFATGSSGYISTWEKEQTKDTPLIIRGLGGNSRKAIQHCHKNNRPYYAIDTGYMQPVGTTKKMYHRITRNNLQNQQLLIERPKDRLARIGYSYKRFTPGSKILICPPSEKVMNLFGQPDPKTWTQNVIKELREYTDRPIEIRLKPDRADRVTVNTMEAALSNDVYCMVTYNSIAAVEAILLGKPAIALGPNAAATVCNSELSEIETLNYPEKDLVVKFAAHLSYCQFTEAEMRSGYAWKIVNET